MCMRCTYWNSDDVVMVDDVDLVGIVFRRNAIFTLCYRAIYVPISLSLYWTT
jgi:hypothetical protein